MRAAMILAICVAVAGCDEAEDEYTCDDLAAAWAACHCDPQIDDGCYEHYYDSMFSHCEPYTVEGQCVLDAAPEQCYEIERAILGCYEDTI